MGKANLYRETYIYIIHLTEKDMWVDMLIVEEKRLYLSLESAAATQNDDISLCLPR